MIRGGFGGGVRTVGRIRRGFGEWSIVGPKRTIYFICGYMEKTKGDFFIAREAFPIRPGFLKQLKCTVYVGLNKILRTMYRAINMTFRSEIHYRAGFIFIKQLSCQRPVVDVPFYEYMPLVAFHAA